MHKFLFKFDRSVIKAVQALPDNVRPVMLLASLIGQPVFTISVGALLVGIGWGRSDEWLTDAGLVIVATITVGSLMKISLRRRRPITDYVAHMRFDTYSFPSGHSVGAVVSYGTLAYLAGLLIMSPWAIAVATLIALVPLVIGISRVYLGAHYPSDVLAGWLVGVAGLAVIICIRSLS